MPPSTIKTSWRSRLLSAFGLAALAFGLWSFVGASSNMPQAGESDHEMARRALREGKVLPLRTVLAQVERDFQGQVLEVELDREDGVFVYEIKLLRQDGQLMKLEVDAASGRVIKAKQKGGH
ncbi:PepSY domain-containing protein [Diaphorobacter sp. HDW4A]|uniref:PepSY domain-containing protein n=1 Tax=Diaphorobacter sp. HDW4A TaxID=2714924 RepID=UPI0019810637|nr:PepSY domain-containing protein [Diaphorobacter sp. HDW4A]